MEVVISGLGVVSALGRGCERLWSAMVAGESGLAPIERFDGASLGAPLAGLVPDRNGAAWRDDGFAALCADFAIAAAREAWADARLDRSGLPATRVALVLGTSLGDQEQPLHRLTAAVADALGVHGPRLTVSTACTSSTNALGLGLELLRMGAADVVIAGGADVLTPLVAAGFHALGVLSPAPCAPFSGPPGTTLGEGAGFAVLERRGAALARGARADRRLLGCGLAADGFHDTGPDPTGAGIAAAMRAALAAAGVGGGQIGYVNAHGTGTVANDPAEWRAIRQVLGARAETIPVSSSKSFLGHAQGAAGILEVIATLLAHDRGAVPPTHNHGGARPNSPADPVAQRTPRPWPYQLALCNSAAFGGANCAVVVGRVEPGSVDPVGGTSSAVAVGRVEAGPVDPDGGTSSAVGRVEAGPVDPDGGTALRPAPIDPPRRDVRVTGLAALGIHGVTHDALADALGTAASRGGHVARYDFEALVPSADPRGLDPASRHLVAAAALALGDAGGPPRGPARARTGLIVGVDRVSPESHAALLRSIEERGLRFLAAGAFSRMVLNAPVGTASRLLALKGPLSTVSAGRASGLCAIAYAAELLAGQVGEGVDRIVAGAVHERGRAKVAAPTDREGARHGDRAGDGEGATCVVLAAGSGAGEPRGVSVRLAGWALAGPSGLEVAAGLALARAGLDPREVGALFAPPGMAAGGIRAGLRFDPAARFGGGHGGAGTMAFAAAALLIRRGKLGSALICATDDGTAACALALVAEGG